MTHTGQKIQFAAVYQYKGNPNRSLPGRGQNPNNQTKHETKHKPPRKPTKKVVTSNNKSVHILTQTGNKYTDLTRLTMNSWEQ